MQKPDLPNGGSPPNFRSLKSVRGVAAKERAALLPVKPKRKNKIMRVNIGDVVSVQNWQLGNGGITGIFRVSGLHRVIQYGGMDEHVEGSVTLELTMEPSSYWT